MKNKMSFISILRRSIFIAYSISPFIIVSFSIILVFNSVLQFTTTYISQIFYDSLALVNSANENIIKIFIGGLMFVLVKIVSQVLSSFQTIVRSILSNKLTLGLEIRFNNKISLIPAQLFEDKYFLDDIAKASAGMDGVIQLLMSISNMLFLQFTYFIIMSVYLYRIQPLLLLSLLLIFVPVAFTQVIQTRIFSDEEREVVPLWRMEDSYYFHAMDTRETRIMGVFHYFNNLRLKVMMSIFHIQWKIQRKLNTIDLLLNLCKVIGWIMIMVLLFYLMMRGDVSIGMFVAIFSSISTMFGFMENMFDTFKNGISSNIGKIANFLEMMDFDKFGQEKKETNLKKFGISAKKLDFEYPHTGISILQDISLDIKPGEIVAIVGENGSGKTTLSKLLCGLYKPSNGRVSVGGCDTIATREEYLFEDISAVFQNYRKYELLSMKENVQISDYSRNRDISDTLILAEIDQYDSETFPNGKDTILSREFGGVDISKGQWQRLAIGRGVYRKHRFILLDEPTAAIDPIEEERIYRQFAKLAKNTTVIFVTHRLASARIADRIIVMVKGKVVEVGNHDELVHGDGVYEKMWTAQASGYLDEQIDNK